MMRRATALVLLLAVAFAGLTVCPRAVVACSMSKPMHKCCAERSTLRAVDCCGGHSQTSRLAMPSMLGVAHQDLAVKLVMSAATIVPTPLNRSLAVWPRHGDPARGLAPPDTLFSRHIALLL